VSTKLFVACRPQGQPHPEWGPVGILEHEGVYRFQYTLGAQKLRSFRPFPEMPELGRVYESEALFPLFANRLLGKRRPEYDAYLRWGGFDPNSSPDPLAILGITEGRRETDAVEVFPCPQRDETGCYTGKFFVHGIRWLDQAELERVAELSAGESLSFQLEDENPNDGQAVAIWTQDGEHRRRIGYVPRYIARDARHLLAACAPEDIHLRVERVNKDAPMQQRLLCKFTSCWPDGFAPCSGEEFLPIVNPVPSASSLG